MNKSKEHNGWPTAIFIVIFTLIASYFFLWGPANKETGQLREEAQQWQEKAANQQEEKITADQETRQLAARATALTKKKLLSELRRLGIDSKNITAIPGGQRLELVGTLSEVGNLISATSGQTYVDQQDQLRGSELVLNAKYQIRSLNDNQYLLRADLRLINEQ
jgi:hypothetical protein